MLGRLGIDARQTWPDVEVLEAGRRLLSVHLEEVVITRIIDGVDPVELTFGPEGVGVAHRGTDYSSRK